MALFSKRTGRAVQEKAITVREDAPMALREFIVMTVYNLNKQPSYMRAIICKVLRVAPDGSNWTEFPNIQYEVMHLIENCEWYYIYDVIEATYAALPFAEKDEFAEEVNDYFKANGIGWKLENGIIEIRGDEIFENAVKKVEDVLDEARLPTAKAEIKEAINDLSRRPTPDITGAIQHSLACLECICREITGNKKATLGDLMKKTSTAVPTPLDQAIQKIWGFTSEQGRHLQEGNPPNYIEAELVVELSAAISTYLGKKLGGFDNTKGKTETVDDLPF